MIVIGTAGHIDHGKSAIVKRLTNTDPDRLPEEQARGMTIDLGFAFFESDGGEEIALVDVPGHERFVKNMIAGAGGIDSVMLVVAADDGWMPQSQEHFQIVRLLGIESGFIVINKIDLADDEWIELLEQDIIDRTSGSFLEGVPVFRVSSTTGEGFDELRSYLNSLPQALCSRSDIGKARLCIDRTFVRPGIGGVVTGTLRGGCLRPGQVVSIWPSGSNCKIRTLHSNNRDVDCASPGQRTAVSFTGVDREKLVRGAVVTDRVDLNFFREHPVLALSIELLREAPVDLFDRRRLLLIIGTTEIEGEVRLLDRKRLGKGESAIVFFKPDEPAYGLIGDYYIVRLPTPMVTIGGGRILDFLPYFPRRREADQYAYLARRLSCDLSEIVQTEIEKLVICKRDTLLEHACWSLGEIEETITLLMRKGGIDRLGELVYSTETIELAASRFVDPIRASLESQPHIRGLNRAQIERLSTFHRSIGVPMTEYLLHVGRLVKSGDVYSLVGRGIKLEGRVKAAYDDIIKSLKSEPLSPPKLSVLTAGGKERREAVRFMIESHQVVKCGADFLFLVESWDDITLFMRGKLSADGRLAVADLRERFGLTRKYAIPILEETDRQGLTKREGDYRVKGERFEDNVAD